jgi:hypothetical protein
MARRSSVKGGASFRRMLKGIGALADPRLVTFLRSAGPVLAGGMQNRIPVLSVPRPNRTPGAARNSISWRVTPSTLNLKVGELSKRDIVFYAHILDVGRKGGNVRVTRGQKSYPNGINVRAMKPRYIIRSVRTQFRLETLPGYRTIMDDILTQASRGAGDD